MDEYNIVTWHMPQPIVVEKRSNANRERNLSLFRDAMPDGDDIDLSEFDPTFFRVIASDQSMDSYFTKMSEQTIRNYVEDAKRGVALQQSHNGHRSLGFGRSLDGEVSGKKGNLSAEILFYTVEGIRSGEITSTELIRGIKSGIYRDVSVGFSPDYFECSICGKDPMDWRAKWEEEEACWHIPGFEYQNAKGKNETAWAWVHNARLNEVSFVYDGSNENAGIIAIEKARMIKATGNLSPQIESILERRYKTSIPDLRRNWRGVETKMEREENGSATELNEDQSGSPAPVLEEENEREQALETLNLSENTESESESPVVELNPVEPPLVPEISSQGPSTPDARWVAVREKYEGDGKLFKRMGDDPVAAVDALASALSEAREKIKENARSVKFGVAYESSLISQCHTEGVRAMGDKYNREHWDGLLKRMDAEEIEANLSQFKEMSAVRFPGGRVTSDIPSVSRSDRESVGAEYTV